METTRVYWGNIGMLEQKMETTIIYYGVMKQLPSEFVRRLAVSIN